MKKNEQAQKILDKTLKLMNKKDHLPGDLIFLLGKTAAMQISGSCDVSLEIAEGDLLASEDKDYLLNLENFPVDKKHALKMATGIIELILNNPDDVPHTLIEPISLIQASIKSGELDFERAVGEILKGGGPVLSTWKERMPNAPATLDFLMSASLAPSFHAVVSKLTEKSEDTDKDFISPRGICPVCGSLPYMLELREKEGYRFATCSVCQHDYRIRRVACPVCDTTDTEKIKTFTVKEEPGFRVETCDNCKTYIKTIDFRNLDRSAFPSLNDLESIALDYLAVEQGFSRTAQSVWKI